MDRTPVKDLRAPLRMRSGPAPAGLIQGEVVDRDGFVFADVVPDVTEGAGSGAPAYSSSSRTTTP